MHKFCGRYCVGELTEDDILAANLLRSAKTESKVSTDFRLKNAETYQLPPMAMEEQVKPRTAFKLPTMPAVIPRTSTRPSVTRRPEIRPSLTKRGVSTLLSSVAVPTCVQHSMVVEPQFELAGSVRATRVGVAAARVARAAVAMVANLKNMVGYCLST